MTRDLKTWSFDELREILGCPNAIEFRLSYAWIDEHGKCVSRGHLVAVGAGEWPIGPGLVTGQDGRQGDGAKVGSSEPREDV